MGRFKMTARKTTNICPPVPLARVPITAQESSEDSEEERAFLRQALQELPRQATPPPQATAPQQARREQPERACSMKARGERYSK